MHTLFALLAELDQLYTTETLTEYEEAIQTVERKVQSVCPGFTIAYAELATVGEKRTLSGAMAHVLVPQRTEER